jgi:hypothetical protein
MLNLCANAIEAMRFVDRVRLLRIRSDIVKESSYVLVSIEDSGTGIDGKDRERVFEPFVTTKSSGTGIGLTICQSIIESHGGSLQVSANHPYGTIFHVALPSRHAESPAIFRCGEHPLTHVRGSLGLEPVSVSAANSRREAVSQRQRPGGNFGTSAACSDRQRLGCVAFPSPKRVPFAKGPES